MIGKSTALSASSLHGGTFRRVVVAVLTVGLVGAFAAPSSASPASSKAHARADGEGAAIGYLRRAVAAPDVVSYYGTRLVLVASPQGTTTVFVDVRHVPGQGTRINVRPDHGDDSAALFLGDRRSGSQSLRPNQLRLLVANFDLRVEGAAVLAGRQAVVVDADHPGVESAKFWIDRSTGLLLRTEVYGANGRLWRASAFIHVRIDNHAFMEHLPPVVQVPDEVAVSRRSIPGLRRAGYPCPINLGSGFTLTDIDRLRESAPVVHMAYTDGLSVISVFEQRGALAPSAVKGYLPLTVDERRVYVRYGLPTSIIWASNGVVYTVLTDAPDSTLAHIVAAYPGSDLPASNDFWSRLWRGLGRLIACACPLVFGI